MAASGSVEATKRLLRFYIRYAHRSSGGKPVCWPAPVGHWWRGKVGPGHGAPLFTTAATTYETRTGRRRARRARSAVCRLSARTLSDRGTREVRPRLPRTSPRILLSAILLWSLLSRIDGDSDDGSNYCGCGATHHTAGKIDV